MNKTEILTTCSIYEFHRKKFHWKLQFTECYVIYSILRGSTLPNGSVWESQQHSNFVSRSSYFAKYFHDWGSHKLPYTNTDIIHEKVPEKLAYQIHKLTHLRLSPDKTIQTKGHIRLMLIRSHEECYWLAINIDNPARLIQ